MNKPEYYFAYIGPADRTELDKNYSGGEGYIRSQTKKAFEKVTGHHAEHCGSGWGVTEEDTHHISFATHNEETKKYIVASYKKPRKEMPRHVKAWDLLLQYERKKN